ncbi:MAG TPA: NAD(P)/FAD-dependent oxidoreductase [Polyangiales bacterium]
MSEGLAALSNQVARELSLLRYPHRDWLSPRRTSAGAHVYDVVIVGGGQSGLAVAFGLMRERVGNLLVVDEHPLDRAGPWLNFARMHTLRTPKYLTGPDLGIPSLTPQAWYEAQFGAGSWEALGLLPKEQWASYLAWYRQTLGIPVQPDTKVDALRWQDGVWEVPCERYGVHSLLYARRVVLATGIDGSGRWEVPALVRDALPQDRYAHTHDPIDFAALRGKRVAVLGAGASAFDNAATALEAGASEARMFFRRSELVRVNPYRWAEFVGFLKHLADLEDHDKWRFVAQLVRMGQLPPKDTYLRARAHAHFHLHPGSSFRRLSMQGDELVLDTESGTYRADFLILGTGFVTDLRLRPELALVEPHIARWRDRYTPADDERLEDLLNHPYLGPNFEFIERRRGAAPYLASLYNYTFGGLLSMGFGGASISGMKYSVPRLVAGITRSLFIEDREQHFAGLCGFAETEF